MEKKKYKYEVAFSFAGEQRDYVEQVASALKKSGVDVYYDEYDEVNAWGENLMDHFDKVYGSESLFSVMFISEEYAKKEWTNYERQILLNRRLKENNLLPARFDDTNISGLPRTIHYIDLREYSPEEFSNIIIQKVKGHTRKGQTKSIAPNFLLPKRSVKINPYKERTSFIDNVTKEIDQRCTYVEGCEFFYEDLGGKRQIRVLYDGETIYSLDIQRSGIGGNDSDISFSLGGGGYNAWGSFGWSKEKESVVLNLNDMSLFDLFSGEERAYTIKEFADKVWEIIVKSIEDFNE